MWTRLLKASFENTITTDFTDENDNQFKITINYTGNIVPSEYDYLDTGVGTSKVKVSDPYLEDIKILEVYDVTNKKEMEQDWINNNMDYLIDIIEQEPVEE
ncbi:MAG: hypothetical protein NC222_06390 [Staphylococcus sp.]|nr:hypothetical protein [Staphylococcus sp.]